MDFIARRRKLRPKDARHLARKPGQSLHTAGGEERSQRRQQGPNAGGRGLGTGRGAARGAERSQRL